MAIFRAETKHISRGKGHNVVAAAAYRAAEKLTDTNKLNPNATTHDYTNKKGVVAKNIVLPTALSNENFSISRQELWSSVEEHETTTRSVKGSRLKKSARLAREWLLALPSELSDDENEQLTVEFTQHLADELGVIGDYCIHKPTIENYRTMKDRIETYNLDTRELEVTEVDDLQPTIEPDKRNIHAHIMFTTRKAELTADGKLSFGEKVHTEKSDRWRRSEKMGDGAEYMKQVRELWAGMVNKRLAKYGIAPISHKSYKDLGINIQPQHKQGKNASVLAVYGFTSISRVRRFNNGYKERNRDAIKSTSDSCTALSNEATNRATRAGNDANAAADRAATAIRGADKWLSRAAPTPFDRKQQSKKLDEQSSVFDRLAERTDRVLDRPIRASAELIEQAIQKYWSIEEWRPTVQKSDWAGGGTRPNPESDPSDDFSRRQQVIIENIEKHISGLDGDSISSDSLRRTLAEPANKQLLTLLTDPEREQAEYLSPVVAVSVPDSVEVPIVAVEPIKGDDEPKNTPIDVPTPSRLRPSW